MFFGILSFNETWRSATAFIIIICCSRAVGVRFPIMVWRFSIELHGLPRNQMELKNVQPNLFTYSRLAVCSISWWRGIQLLHDVMDKGLQEKDGQKLWRIFWGSYRYRLKEDVDKTFYLYLLYTPKPYFANTNHEWPHHTKTQNPNLASSLLPGQHDIGQFRVDHLRTVYRLGICTCHPWLWGTPLGFMGGGFCQRCRSFCIYYHCMWKGQSMGVGNSPVATCWEEAPVECHHIQCCYQCLGWRFVA